MNVVVLGCGRVGSRLARVLDAEGHRVCVVDQNADQFKRLGSDYRGQTVLGNGIDADVLRSAGIEEADAFIAVTNGDNTNIMTAQIAKVMFNVPRVICRIYDPIREDTYHMLGLDTICPTTIIADLIHEHLTGSA